jgi:hypothetical protein
MQLPSLPKEFSAHARERMMGAWVRAQQDFQLPRQKLSFIPRIIAAFGHEACLIGRTGVWTSDLVDEQVRSYLKMLVIEVQTGYIDLDPALMMTFHNQSIQPAILRQIEESEEWKKYEAQLTTIDAVEENCLDSKGRSAPPRSGAYPNRAAWLKVRLGERAWNKNDVRRFGGPDRRTVQRILDGVKVREDGLELLASALSKKGQKITPSDIPSD